ncbi:MAG: pyridoxamine 5'-phosphate oxidase [Methylotenera sp. RIFCSPLOWO2_02_FULL_45_14]|nr:MAG: pyridoxamine 5'-phosphate oxidase [Methylotenera sp. RIFCSPLOWO2_02_FULL_45_14]
MSNLAPEAKQFLRSTHSGILSTHSAKFDGYPFGSVAPFVLGHDCQPVILISSIAEHTKNIILNPKVSLLVFAGAEDLQANSRLTLLGTAVKIEKNDADLRARYLRYLPQAASYFDMHDFAFYRINIAHARYIGGFGNMSWLSSDDFFSTSVDSLLAAQETAIIEHMNTDHAQSLIAYCKYFHQVEATHAQMLGIDSEGFDVNANNDKDAKILRFDFNHPIHDAQSARAALVRMSQLAKT